MKYVVTAINRLTGERVPISSPHTEHECQVLLRKFLSHTGKIRTRPWLRPRIDVAAEEGELSFTPP